MRKILLVLAAFIFFKAQAQTPIQVNAQLLPPYSLQVSDYYSPTASGGQKLNLILLNRDFLRSTINVRLRMVIESQGVRIATREDVTWPTVTLISGTPYYVSPAELATYFNPNNLIFSGISQEQYTTTGKLPEGFYTFCFETVEPATGLTVSNKGCAFAWMTMSDPPFLNIPAKAETVTPTNPQNIIFQWTPRHTASPTAGFSTDYVFTITEVQANDFSPESAFTSHQALYTDSTQATMYNYGISKPQLIAGKRYAWRVQAKAKQGLDNLAMFRNLGYSEVFWFDYKNNCNAPLNINAVVQGSRVTITWQAQPIYLSYKVQYREKDNASAEWFTISTMEPTVVINDLNFSKIYEYRVGASCEEESFNYSNLLSFTTGAAAVPVIANCGDSSAIPNSVAQTYLATMAVGDTILAGDFKVKILTISGSTNFTGTGTVKIPWLLGVKAAVKFTNIKVNTLKQLAVGNIETTYDPKEAGILNVDDVIDVFAAGYGVGGVVSGQAGADTTLPFTIAWPGGIAATTGPGFNPITGNGPVTITVTPVGGGASVTYTVQHLPITIMDASGNIYQVNNTTPPTVTLIGQIGGKDWLAKATKGLIDADKAIVKFITYNDPKVIYAFDEWNPLYKKSGTFNKEYEKISCAGGGDCIDGGAYYVSAKAIAPGKTDYLKATVTLIDNSINPDSIQFVNGKGIIYLKKRVDSAAGVYRYEIAVVGGPEKDAQEIYALYPKAGSKTYNLGKVLVASYPNQKKKISLVPVLGATVNKDSIIAKLNKVYGKINVDWEVKLEPNFSYKGWDLNSDNKLSVEGSGLLSSYTSEMRALNGAYSSSRNVDPAVIYLFILNQAAESSGNVQILGDMPRSKQFGYLFTGTGNQSVIATTAAHEIGHGVFSLKHVFDYSGLSQGLLIPANLMDYPSGDYLTKLQWDFIHDPAIVFGLFEKDVDNQNKIIIIDSTFLNSDNSTVSFLSELGSVLSIPYAQLNTVEFTYGSLTAPNQDPRLGLTYHFQTAEGLLFAFTLKNGNNLDKYKFNSSTKTYRIEATGVNYTDNTDYTKVDGVIFPMPCGSDYNLYKFSKGNLPKYVGGSGDEITFSTLWPIFKPFSDNLPLLKEGKTIKQSISNDINPDCLWCRTDATSEMTKNYCEKPELWYIDKAAQLRVIFPEYFSQFTQLDENWAKPVQKVNVSGGTGGAGYSYTSDTTWAWGKYLYNNPALVANYTSNTNLKDYFYAFCYKFRDYVDTSIIRASQFWTNLNASSSASELVTYLKTEPLFQTSKAPIDKRKLAIKLLTNQSVPDAKEEAVIKILSSVAPEDQDSMLVYIAREIKIKRIFSKFDDSHLWYGGDNFTKVVTLLSGFIQNPIYNQNCFLLAADTLNPKFISIDQDILDNRQTSLYSISEDNKISFIDLNNSTIYSSIPYNEMVPVQFWSEFDLGERTFKRKEIVPVPAMFAALLIDKGEKALFSKKAWLLVDGVMMFVGIGEIKVAWSAASWIRKAMLVSNMVGTTVGIVNELAPESLIPEKTKKNIRIGCLLLQAPEIIRGLGQIKNSLTSKGDEAAHYADNVPGISNGGRARLREFAGMARTDAAFAEDAAQVSRRVVTLGADVDKAKQWLNIIGSGDNKIYIVAHAEGNTFSILRRTSSGGTVSSLDEAVIGHRSLAKWIQSKEFPTSQDIVLLTCSDIETAQNLSNKLGRKVIASDGAVSIHSDGGIKSDKPFLELNPPVNNVAVPPVNYSGSFIVPSPSALKLTLRSGWKSFIDDLADWDQELKAALDASISSSQDLRILFTNAVNKEELAYAWRSLRNTAGNISASNALYKNPLALQAFVKIKKNPKFVEMGLDDLIISRIRGYGSTTEVASYDAIIGQLDELGYFLHSHTGTTMENFGQLVSILQSNANNYKQGVSWVIRNVTTDAATFAGKNLKFEYRVTNIAGNSASLDLVIGTNPSLKFFEFKNGPGSITSSTIINQFIGRDLKNITNLDNLQWRILNKNLTKQELLNYMGSTEGKNVINSLINDNNVVLSNKVKGFFGMSTFETSITNAQISTFLDINFTKIFKIY